MYSAITYSYDAAGNRTGRSVDGVAESYTRGSNTAYQLESVDGRSFTYDAAGRVQTDSAGGGITLTHNAAGQLTDDGTTAFAYDGTGQRITSGNTQHAVAPAAQNLGLEIGLRYLTADDTDRTDATTFVFAGENPIGALDATGTIRYYLEDATDSVRALSDDSGNVAAGDRYDYSAFGDELSPNSTPTEGFGYHGAWHDASGLIDMRARAYDPTTGRFTAPDPVAPDPSVFESFHPYTFANQNPMVFSDPTGGFSLNEINITNLISVTLRASQQAAIQFIRDEARDAVQEVAVDLLLSAISGLLPGGNLLTTVRGAANSVQAGGLFGAGMRSVICDGGAGGSVGQYFRFEVPIDPRTGHVTGNGLGCDAPNLADPNAGGAGVRNLRDLDTNQVLTRKPIRPDAIAGPPGVVSEIETNHGGPGGPNAYVVAEFKISAATLRQETNRPTNRQILGIAEYTKRHTHTKKVAAFFTLFDRNTRRQNADYQIAATVRNLQREGLVGVVVSLTNRVNPFKSGGTL